MKIWILPIIILFLFFAVFVRVDQSVAQINGPEIDSFRSTPLSLIQP